MDASKLFDVKDKVVLVSGGGKGIGKMIATGFVAGGAKVYITSRDAKALQAAADELNKLGPGRCDFIAADMQKFEDCKKIAEELGKKEKALHVLVNNAGANWGATLSEYPDEAFTKVMTLNTQRVFTLTQQLTPLLLAGVKKDPNSEAFLDPSRIINIGSVDGLRVPELETYAYSASKAALHHLSRVLAAHLGKEGITSNTIACGPFESKMMKQTLEMFRESIEAGVPLRRIGSPEDVAGTCLFLSSRAGAYVNGATITLDGGMFIAPKI